MEIVTDRELEAAEARGAELLASEPRAEAVRYSPNTRRVELTLVNGCTYGFPVDLVQDLQEASEPALAEIEIDGAGFNLHWPSLNVDLCVPALIAGVFGTKAWMGRALARQAGSQTSAAKTAAARANGAKGGRPKKIANS